MSDEPVLVEEADRRPLTPRTVEAIKRNGLLPEQLSPKTKNDISKWISSKEELGKKIEDSTVTMFMEHCEQKRAMRCEQVNFTRTQIVEEEKLGQWPVVYGSQMKSTQGGSGQKSGMGMSLIEKEHAMLHKMKHRQEQEIQKMIEGEERTENIRMVNDQKMKSQRARELQRLAELDYKKQQAEKLRKQQEEVRKQRELEKQLAVAQELDRQARSKQLRQAQKQANITAENEIKRQFRNDKRIKQEQFREDVMVKDKVMVESKWKNAQVKEQVRSAQQSHREHLKLLEMARISEQKQTQHLQMDDMKKNKAKAHSQQIAIEKEAKELKEAKRIAAQEIKVMQQKQKSQMQGEILQKKLDNCVIANDSILEKKRTDFDKRQKESEIKRSLFEKQKQLHYEQVHQESIKKQENIEKVLQVNKIQEEEKKEVYNVKVIEEEKKKEIRLEKERIELIQKHKEIKQQEEKIQQVLVRNDENLEHKKNGYLAQFAKTDSKVARVHRKIEQNIKDKHYSKLLKELDKEESLMKSELLEKFKTEKLLEKIAADTAKKEQIEMERAKLIKMQEQVKKEMQDKREKYLKEWEDKKIYGKSKAGSQMGGSSPKSTKFDNEASQNQGDVEDQNENADQ